MPAGPVSPFAPIWWPAAWPPQVALRLTDGRELQLTTGRTLKLVEALA